MNNQPQKPNLKKIAVVIIPVLFAIFTTVAVATMMSRNPTLPSNGDETPAASSPNDIQAGADPTPPEEQYSAGLSYRTSSDGSVSIIGLGSCADRIVRIPPTTENGTPITAIGDSAFASVTGIDEVVLPGSIVSIGAYAFKGSSIGTITLGGSVMSIGTEAFADCYNLASINVDGANAMFASMGGVLFDRSMSVIICYPSGRPDPSYIIPEGVTEIKERAFSACPSLRALKFEGNADQWKKVRIGSGNSLIDRLTVEVDTSDK